MLVAAHSIIIMENYARVGALSQFTHKPKCLDGTMVRITEPTNRIENTIPGIAMATAY